MITAHLVLAAGGAIYFGMLMLWLASAILASELAKRKGYTEKLGLGTGLILSFVGAIIWLFVPPKADSPWRQRKAQRERARAAASQ